MTSDDQSLTVPLPPPLEIVRVGVGANPTVGIGFSAGLASVNLSTRIAESKPNLHLSVSVSTFRLAARA